MSISLKTEQETEGIFQAIDYIDFKIENDKRFESNYYLDNNLGNVHALNSLNKAKILANISTSRDHRSFSSILEYLNNSPESYELNFISDFQKSVSIENVHLDTLYPVQLIQIDLSKNSNVYIDSVYLEELYLSADSDNHLKIDFKVNGNIPTVQSYQVKVLNRSNLLSTYLLELGADTNSKSISVPIDVNTLENNQIVVEVMDPDVIYDNKHYVALADYTKPKVVHIYDDVANSYITAIYQNTDLFDFQSFDLTNPAYKVIENADLVILDQVREIPKDLLINFNNNVLVIPETSDKQLSGYEELLNFKVEKIALYKSKLSSQSLQSTLFKGAIDDYEQNVGLPEFKPQYKFEGDIQDELIDSFGRPILSFSNNTRSKTYIFSVPLSQEFTDLGTHSLFVPLMYNIAFEAIVVQPINSYRLSSEYIKLPLQLSEDQESLSVSGNGYTFVPNYIRGENYLQIELPPEINEPGFYYLLSATDTLIDFSLNLDKIESIMDFSTKDELMALADQHPNVNYVDASSREKIINAEISQGASLWKYALVLSLIFLISESLVARYL